MMDEMIQGRIHYLTMIALALLHFTTHVCAQPKPAANPWEGKDWRQWTAKECKRVLEDSPWAKTKTIELSGGAQQWIRVQFRSALPVRQALARQTLLKKKYDKADPAQRQALEKAAEQQIAQNLNDQIVVHVEYGTGGNWQVIGNPGYSDGNGNWMPETPRYFPARHPDTGDSAILMLDFNNRVPMIRRTAEHKRQFEIHFPRASSGQPLLQPDSPNFLLMLTGENRRIGENRRNTIKIKASVSSSQNVPPETLQKIKEAIEFSLTVRQQLQFEPSTMLYQGRLEY